jgi:hypothetical protein
MDPIIIDDDGGQQKPRLTLHDKADAGSERLDMLTKVDVRKVTLANHQLKMFEVYDASGTLLFGSPEAISFSIDGGVDSVLGFFWNASLTLRVTSVTVKENESASDAHKRYCIDDLAPIRGLRVVFSKGVFSWGDRAQVKITFS